MLKSLILLGATVVVGSVQANVKDCMKRQIALNNMSQQRALAFCTSRRSTRVKPRRNLRIRNRIPPIVTSFPAPRINLPVIETNNQNQNADFYVRNERAFDVNDKEFVTIMFQDRNGKYTTRDENDGAINNYERFTDLAKLSGCGVNGKFCVGEKAFDVNDKEYVRVIAIQSNGKYVTKDINDGALNTYERNQDLAKTTGCLNNYYPCVGARAFDRNDREEVEIIAIMQNGKFVTRDINDGALNTYERLDQDFFVY